MRTPYEAYLNKSKATFNLIFTRVPVYQCKEEIEKTTKD